MNINTSFRRPTSQNTRVLSPKILEGKDDYSSGRKTLQITTTITNLAEYSSSSLPQISKVMNKTIVHNNSRFNGTALLLLDQQHGHSSPRNQATGVEDSQTDRSLPNYASFPPVLPCSRNSRSYKITNTTNSWTFDTLLPDAIIGFHGQRGAALFFFLFFPLFGKR